MTAGGQTPAAADRTVSFPTFVVMSVLFAVAIPALLVRTTPEPQNPVWTGALLLTCGSGVRYAWLIADGRQRLIEMTVWLFTYVFLGLAPLAQLRQGISPETTPRTFQSHSFTAVTIVAVGSLAFLVGSRFHEGRTIRRRTGRATRPASPRPPGPVDPARQGVVAPAEIRASSRPRPTAVHVLAAVSIVLTGYFLVKVRSGLFTNLRAVGDAAAAAWPNSAVLGVVLALAVMPLTVSFVSLILLRRRPEYRPSGWQRFLYVLTGLLLVITVNPLNSPRYVFGTVFLAVAAAFGLFATPRRFQVVAVSAVLAFIVVFPIADAFRNADSRPVAALSPATSLLSGDYDSFAQIDNTVLFVERQGFTDGRQAVGVALFWVPRATWPEKPEDTGIVLADFRGYAFTNLSAPLWAELYVNFGWLGVVAGGAAFGLWGRRRDEQTCVMLRDSRAPDVLGCLLPFYLIFLMRGSLLQAMANLLVLVGSAWFVNRGGVKRHGSGATSS